MKIAQSKIRNLVLDVIVFLGLVLWAIAFATHGLYSEIPSLY